VRWLEARSGREAVRSPAGRSRRPRFPPPSLSGHVRARLGAVLRQDADGWNVELAALDLEQQRVTVAEAAKRLNVSHSAIRTLCRRGLLPYGRVLNFIRLRPEDVERFMVQGRS